MSDDPERARRTASAELAQFFRDSLAAAASEAPSFDEVADYVEGRLAPDARDLFELRLAEDPLLRAEVQDLLDLRAEMAATAPVVRRPAWIPWAIAASLLAAAAVYWQRTAHAPAGVTAETSPGPAAPLALLRDAQGVVTLRADGTLQGIVAPGPLQSSIADALSSGTLRLPPTRADLAVSAVTVMGPRGRRPTFAPLAPLSAVLRTDRPRFRWSAQPDARSYVVSVFDLGLEKVASSPPLTGTEWVPARALPRGRTYVWQVEARTASGTVAAPAPPAAEARFHVASADAAAKVDAAMAQSAGSHLAAGVALAEAGFLEEAAEELRGLAEENPQSIQVRRLLDALEKQRDEARE